MTPPEYMVTNIIGVAIAAGVSFVIAVPLVRSMATADVDSASEQMREMKGTSEAAVISNTEGGKIVEKLNASK